MSKMLRMMSVLLMLVLTWPGGMSAFGVWEPPTEPYETLEEAIISLEEDLQRAIEGNSASPGFLRALEGHVAHLYSILAKLRDSEDALTEDASTPLSVGSRSEYSAGGINFLMRLAPKAMFPKGTRDRDTAEVHNKFWIAETEVTYELWYTVRQWALDNGYAFANAGREGSHGYVGEAPSPNRNLPVTEINQQDSIVWTNALSEMLGYQPVYTYQDNVIRDATVAAAYDNVIPKNTDGFRLPTNDEWELAARYQGNDSSNNAIEVDGLYWIPGNHASGAAAAYDEASATQEVAWYNNNSSAARDVGQKQANALGLFDMSGNVNEWTFTDSRYNRIGGGSWYYSASSLQVGAVRGVLPDAIQDDRGLRITRTQL